MFPHSTLPPTPPKLLLLLLCQISHTCPIIHVPAAVIFLRWK